MPAGCRVVAEPDDIDEVATALRSLRIVQDVLTRFPALQQIVRKIAPALDLTTYLKRLVIGHAVLRENRQAAIQAAIDEAITRTGHLTDHFNLDAQGFVDMTMKSGKVVRQHINDVLEGNLGRYQLSAEQRAALQARKDVWDDVRFDYNKFGGKLSADEDLFPRVVKGYTDPAGVFHTTPDNFSGASTIKTAGSFSRSRGVDPQTGKILSSEEMVGHGFTYWDPDHALLMKAQEIGRRTADEQLVTALKKLPQVQRDQGHYPYGAPGDIYGKPGEFIDLGHFDSNVVRNLQGYVAPKEIADYINDVLKRPERVQIPVLSRLAQASREAIASFDFGTIGVQLLLTLGADLGHILRSIPEGRWVGSNIFGNAVASSFKSFMEPDFLGRYFAANKEVIDRWSSYIGGLRNTEYFLDLTHGGGAIPILRSVERPFARAFETSLDVAKIEYIKALERIHGTNLSPAEMEALGSVVRNMTGMLSSNRLGISGFQQSVEATMMFFSPRYTRSLFGLFGAIFSTNKARAEALGAIGAFALAGLATYYFGAQAMGQKPRLDPTQPGFLALNFGGNWVGIGGGVRAMSQLVGRSVDTARTDPTRFLDFKNASPTDGNPILSFWKSRSAPLISPITTIWTGEDFRGVPIKSKTDWAKAVADKVQPFALQAALEAHGALYTKASMGLLSGIGAQTNPLSPFQAYDEYLKEQVDASGVARFPDGAQTVNSSTNGFTNFIQTDPQAQYLREQYQQSRLARGDQSQQILSDRATRIKAADALLAQTGDYRQYRSQINSIRDSSRSAMQALALDGVSSTADKKLVNSWYATYDDPRAKDPVTGAINSDGLDQVQAEWEKAHPGEYERLILPNETTGETPQETQLRQDRKFVSDAGWWATDDQAWQQLQNTATGQRLNLGQYKHYVDYVQAARQKYEKLAASRGLDPITVGDMLLTRDPLAQAFNQLRARDRTLLEVKNPRLVGILAKWGYSTTSQQEAGIAQLAGQTPGLASG